MYTGKLTIAPSHDSCGKNVIHMTIEDADYRKVCEVYIDPDKFGLAVVGHACQPCDIDD